MQSAPKSRCVTWERILLGITHRSRQHDCYIAALDFPKLLLSYFQRLDDGPIEPVQFPLKAAVIPPATIFFSYINCHVLARKLEAMEGIQGMQDQGDGGYTFDIIGASVPINAFYVVTFTAKFAGRHTAYVL